MHRCVSPKLVEDMQDIVSVRLWLSINTLTKHTNVGQVPIMLVIIQAITDYKGIGDIKTFVINRYFGDTPVGFVE